MNFSARKMLKNVENYFKVKPLSYKKITIAYSNHVYAIELPDKRKFIYKESPIENIEDKTLNLNHFTDKKLNKEDIIEGNNLTNNNNLNQKIKICEDFWLKYKQNEINDISLNKCKHKSNFKSINIPNVDTLVSLYLGFPKILFYDENYRIEEYVEHDEVEWCEIENIAKAAVSYHRQNISFLEDYDSVLSNISGIDFKNTKFGFSISSEEKIIRTIFNKIKNIKFSEIMKQECAVELNTSKNLYFMDKVQDNDSDETICKICYPLFHHKTSIVHNDIHLKNMMKIGEDIRLIDYEYTSTGCFLMDIGNIFCEKMFDYTVDCIPKMERGYSENDKKIFIFDYLKIMFNQDFKKNNENSFFIKKGESIFENLNFKDCIYFENDIHINNFVSKVLKFIDKIQAYSHLFWYLWSRKLILQNKFPCEDFDYKIYSEYRLLFLFKKGMVSRDEIILLSDELN
ncbi:hypothetical protein LUQ84_001405 [Hamiltosporidium tvaerminnensis]|nr:hypothetical protein LUQ84_001405 [Hamiltosporidium tvaerminnensis]